MPPVRAHEPRGNRWEEERRRRDATGAEDARVLRRAVAAAVAAHIALLLVHLPDLHPAGPTTATAEEPQPVLVLEEVRFRRPEPPPPEPTPTEEPARPVPMPDDTPDGPEPIRRHELPPPPPLFASDDLGLLVPEAPPVPEPSGPIYVTGAVTRPVPIATPTPRYTEPARRARITGTVILQAVIDTSGRVVEVEILRRLPFGLTEAAAEAVGQWRFEPATLEGKPVAVYYTLTIRYELG